MSTPVASRHIFTSLSASSGASSSSSSGGARTGEGAEEAFLHLPLDISVEDGLTIGGKSFVETPSLVSKIDPSLSAN